MKTSLNTNGIDIVSKLSNLGNTLSEIQSLVNGLNQKQQAKDTTISLLDTISEQEKLFLIEENKKLNLQLTEALNILQDVSLVISDILPKLESFTN